MCFDACFTELNGFDTFRGLCKDAPILARRATTMNKNIQITIAIPARGIGAVRAEIFEKLAQKTRRNKS